MGIILISLIAGVVGMGAGAIITAVFGGRTDKMIGIFLSFAGGVMISVVLIELLPEAMEYSNLAITVIGLIIGAFLVYILNNVMDKVSGSKPEKSKVHNTYEEFFHATDVIARKKSLMRSGMVLLFAIGLHNIPEGLAIGAAGHHDISLGLTLAIVIGFHNLPEGMAVAAPLIGGGLSRLKTVGLVMLIGTTTVIGTIFGVLVGGISYTALALCFAAAGGAMLYVVFGEILPQAILMNKDRLPTAYAFAGIIVGLLIIEIF